MGAISIGLLRGSISARLCRRNLHVRCSLVCFLYHCSGLSTNSPHHCATICRGCEIRSEQGIRVCRTTLTLGLFLGIDPTVGTVSDGLIPFGSFLSYFFGHSRRQSGSEEESFAATRFGRPKDLAYIKDEAWGRVDSACNCLCSHSGHGFSISISQDVAFSTFQR
jgi:hypothetical protein